VVGISVGMFIKLIGTSRLRVCQSVLNHEFCLPRGPMHEGTYVRPVGRDYAAHVTLIAALSISL
jgi:hypothetical protein